MGLMNPPPADPSLRFKVRDWSPEVEQKIMCTSLGIHVEGAANFWPDTSSQHSAMLGVVKRIGTKMPDIDEQMFKEFMDFSVDFICNNFKDCILPMDVDLSVETWLENCNNYRQCRKDQLMKTYEEFIKLVNKDLDVESHAKYESYTEPKFFRGIFSRTDTFKLYFGPICAAIGKILFSKHWFVKYDSIEKKVQRMKETFDKDFIKIFSNDFSSFEATFVEKLMNLELFFFWFCLQNLAVRDEVMSVLYRIKQGQNKLKFRTFVAYLIAKRYSGEMDTSLSNSIVNLCLMCFLLHKAGHPPSFYIEEFPPTVEGDDSEGAYIHELDPDILKKLGANAKIEVFNTYSEASFCGVCFGSEDGSIVKDPIKVLLDFGWTNYRYIGSNKTSRLKLIKAKSLSLLYNYPGCPILRSLALYGLRITDHIDSKHAIHKLLKGTNNTYERHLIGLLLNVDLSRLVSVGVHYDSRVLVEQKFGVAVDEQIILEKYLDSLTTLQTINHPIILDRAGSDRCKFFETNVIQIPKKDVRYEERETSLQFMWKKKILLGLSGLIN